MKTADILFSADELRVRAAGVLLSARDAATQLLEPEKAGRSSHRAAVLIPIIDRFPEATVLLTRRNDHLSLHAGQIAFPGGRIEAADKSPVEAALREAEEEIGLGHRFVALIGFLDCYHTNKGFCIAPAIGVVNPDFTLKLDSREVAEVFEVPLRFLMTAENHEFHELTLDGKRRDYYAMPYQGRHIWGVTAGILRSLYEQLYAVPAPQTVPPTSRRSYL